MKNKEKRVIKFVQCLGNGKTIYQCEEENDLIDEEMERCRCNEGISNGKEFDCSCRIHKGN